MTALEVLNRVDARLHNVFTWEEKLYWLNGLEQLAYALLGRCGVEHQPENLKPETLLIIPEPFSQAYDYWLEAQIHYACQEYLKYNNAMQLFQSLWQEYANSLRRENPGEGRRTFF